jgi:hypothetical protein
MSDASKAADKKARDEAAAAVKKEHEERAKVFVERTKEQEKLKPTPTQEENDLAAVGLPVEHKEPDGSGPTVITRTIVANQPVSDYSTRAIAAGDKAGREAAMKEYEAGAPKEQSAKK